MCTVVDMSLIHICMLAVGTAFPAKAAVVDTDTAKFVRGTTINSVDVSKQTATQAKGYLEGYFNEHYEIKIQDADGNLETLKGTDEMCIRDSFGSLFA